MTPIPLSKLNAMDRAAFVAALGGVFEHSPWIAEAAHGARPFANLNRLHGAMIHAVETAGAERQTTLIAAHPDLAGKAARAGNLTADSTREQASAGLDRLSEAEYARFHRLNAAYRRKFGFPFIVAVRLNTKHTILAAFVRRLRNDAATERAAALEQIYLITRLRLEALVKEG
ncbi:MAG: 2-oxo-4-hydroxy-4-carboxy-5-ureidoimidazoline decarboxylase [Alphaproteobacteria bacterium]|nr:2-oxo-4-hydroxy-4-carboxy-5-ureidoimidazoline decarboxylase [Alphaproteobacteria bacterium]